MTENITKDIMRALPGDTIRCLTLNGGYNSDEERARKYLKKGNLYTVTHVEVGGWRTEVWVEGIDDSFNSVHFEEWDE